MTYTFVPMTQAYAEAMIAAWKYDGEYAIYDLANEADHLCDAEGWGRGIFAALDAGGDLVGELSVEFYDEQGQYTEYYDYGDDAFINQRQLWVGFALRPDLVGRGRGAEFVTACVEFAMRQCRYRGEFARLGVALFNQRAIRAYERAGFESYDRIVGEISGRTFECVYMRKRLRDV